MTDLLSQILTHWSAFFASGTIWSSIVFAAVLTSLLTWLMLIVPRPAGPLYVCACGLRYRQRDEEPRRAFHRRQAAHLDVCPATGGAA